MKTHQVVWSDPTGRHVATITGAQSLHEAITVALALMHSKPHTNPAVQEVLSNAKGALFRRVWPKPGPTLADAYPEPEPSPQKAPPSAPQPQAKELPTPLAKPAPAGILTRYRPVRGALAKLQCRECHSYGEPEGMWQILPPTEESYFLHKVCTDEDWIDRCTFEAAPT